MTMSKVELRHLVTYLVIQAVAELGNATGNFVKVDRLLLTATLQDIH